MSETLTPVFRLEYFITAAANGTPCDLEPIFNEEKYLHAIAGASVDLPMPVGRTQEYLAKLAGMDVEIPDKPIYRTEYYLAHMIDSTVECPAPIFREEMFYYEWASNEYVTISGNPVSFTALRSAPLKSLKVALSPIQVGSGDPSPDNIRPISGHDVVDVWVADDYDTTLDPTISISLPNTVYGGELDVVTGEGAECPYYASYNGETLVGPWMSSMDKYEAGTTPTIGAQVVDMGGATTPFSTTPTPINSLVGENNVWSDGDTVEVTVRDAFTDLTFDIFSKLVKKGTASSIIPVGKQIDDTWNLNGTDYEAPWDVVHYDSAGNAYLNWHYAFPFAVPFDEPEAIYYAPNGLAAGTYYITIGFNYGNGWVKDNRIYFTLTEPMAADDQLFIDCGKNNANNPADGRTWSVFAKGSSTVKQTGTTASSGDGTELGSTSSANANRTNGLINAPSRVVYGYNRWSQSAIRQWLNSDGAAGTWWSPQNGWDRPTTVNQRGFLAGCTADFLAILKPTEVVTVLNSQEGFAETTETTIDRVFLPALEQWDINPELTGEGEPWAYYEDLAEQAGLSGKFQRWQTYEILKKYNVTAKTSAVAVWLRSAYRGYAGTAWYVYSSVGISSASNGNRGCPACIIKK